MRPGDRPPVQRSDNRPLMWNCCRQLRDRMGNRRSFNIFGAGSDQEQANAARSPGQQRLTRW
jgi:hypothetical protein